MAKVMRGALIEYGAGLIGPIPNVVIFQFNPETVSRTIMIPGKPLDAKSRETQQVGDPPVEKISLNIRFNASDQLADNNPLARLFGVGPRLAALEKMVYPISKSNSLVGAALDAIGDALFGGGDKPPEQPIPREKMPKLLLIWGLTRILPVVIESMTITEQLYDHLLNPIQAEVALSLSVNGLDPCADDPIGKGAFVYTTTVKDAQALLNLANTAGQITDLIPF